MCSGCSDERPQGAPRTIGRRQFLKLSGAGVAAIAMLGTFSGEALAQTSSSVENEFEDAARKYGVPKDLLLAIGYVNSLWEMPPRQLGKYDPGNIHGMGGYGIMHLRRDPESGTLGEAAKLTGFSADRLETSRSANIMGGAAVLAQIQGHNTPSDINGWYATVENYGGDSLYANQVYETLKSGASEKVSGQQVHLAPQPQAQPQTTYAAMASADYSRATWYGASSSNYTPADRPHDLKINTIVVHVTQGSWSSAIDWFNNPSAQVSAHYVVRRSDGKIGQCVREHDIAWHAGNWTYNQHSIGIEHEGYADNANTWTDTMIHSSARLTAYLCKKYNIPIDRNHIIGHNEVPGSTHYCPGPYFPYKKYIRLVRYYADGSSSGTVIYQQIVDNSSSRFSASKNWSINTWNSEKYGKSYRAAKPKAVSDPAQFLVKIPSTNNYVVYARWPADTSYNGSTPIGIKTTSGIKWVRVDQRKNGGRWVKLGSFKMPAGAHRKILVSRWTSSQGWVIADAVMVRRYA